MAEEVTTIPITEYSWWGGDNPPPAELKTQKQLAEIGLRAVQPVGVIRTKKYDCYLYDPRDLASARPKKQATRAQLENLEKGRKKQQYEAWYRNWGWMHQDGNAAIAWAREFLSLPNAVVLDTETTGLDSPEIIEIAVLDRHRNVLFHSLVKPTKAIEAEAIAIHGITEEQLQKAPAYADIHEALKQLLSDKLIAIYNADFDLSALRCSRQACGLKKPQWEKDNIACAMYQYARYCREWSNYYKDYKWQSLPGAGHRAIADCLALIDLIESMAKGEPVDLAAAFEKFIS